MRRNRRNCRLRLGLADRARGRGIAAGRYYNSRIAKLFPRFSAQPQEIDQTKVNAVGFFVCVQTPAGELLGDAGLPLSAAAVLGRLSALGETRWDAPPKGFDGFAL
jgi:hypothetical protein